jgi:hypothetical protein
LLITTETPKDAYDALHAVQEKAEQLGIVFDEFDEEELGFENSHVRKMTKVSELIEKGDFLLRGFERLNWRSPMPGIFEHLACPHCGSILTVNGNCPNTAEGFHSQEEAV